MLPRIVPLSACLLDRPRAGEQDEGTTPADEAGNREEVGAVVGARARRLPFGYRLAAFVIRRPLMVLTKRDWRGQENLPSSGGYVVSPNHISHVDPLIFAHFMYDSGREAYFLGKESLFTVPVVGWVLHKAGQIPVYRGSAQAADSYRAAVAAVHEGKPVGIFPEGTITRDPQLWPMKGKTGAARVALETRCPLIPVAQWGAHEILAPYTKRPHLLPRHTMHVYAGPPVDLSDLYDRPIDTRVLREATDRLMLRITEQLEVLREEAAPGSGLDPRASGIPETGNPHKRTRGRIRGRLRSREQKP